MKMQALQVDRKTEQQTGQRRGGWVGAGGDRLRESMDKGKFLFQTLNSERR